MKQIAIDGPAGAGKSTIAKALSEKLGLMYVDTGAMYRSIALYCLRKGTDINDEEAVSADCKEAPVKVTYENGKQYMYLKDEDVTTAIREEEVGNAASDISKYASVRERLVSMQQELGEEYDVVMDGRDIGTCVLPDAPLKIYLTASVEVRAERRYKEYLQRGEECSLEEVKRSIEERDYNDMHRAISPLKKADDAIEVDTSYMNIEQVVDAVTVLYHQVYGNE